MNKTRTFEDENATNIDEYNCVKKVAGWRILRVKNNFAVKLVEIKKKVK